VGDHPFAVLLVALVAMVILAPSISTFGKFTELFHGLRALTPLSLIVVAASMLALWERARHHALHMFAAGVVILLLTIGSVITHRAWFPFQMAAQIIFQAYVLWVVMRAVFSERRVTGDVLCGAVSAYLLTGVLAGLVFVEIELFAPGSFRVTDWASSAPAQQASLINDPGWLMYFSFVTLTTVGYGDVLPVSSLARSASITVAVIGQILLMVLIARLVAINASQGTSDQNDGPVTGGPER
jgi:hypothetical protein